jgi:hypothetical protein
MHIRVAYVVLLIRIYEYTDCKQFTVGENFRQSSGSVRAALLYCVTKYCCLHPISYVCRIADWNILLHFYLTKSLLFNLNLNVQHS